jgi:hypothetical protein
MPIPNKYMKGMIKVHMHFKYIWGKLSNSMTEQSKLFFNDWIGSPTTYGRNVSE